MRQGDERTESGSGSMRAFLFVFFFSSGLCVRCTVCGVYIFNTKIIEIIFHFIFRQRASIYICRNKRTCVARHHLAR